MRKWLPLATLVVLVILVGVAQPSFLQPARCCDLASDTAVLFILATGVTFVIMLGGIDLSIQSMASLASVIVALTVARLGYGSFLLAIAIGALAGLLSGTRPRPAEDPLLHRHARDGRRAVQRGAGHLEGALDHAGRRRARLSELDHRQRARRAERHRRRPDRAGGRPRAASPHAVRPLQRRDRRRRAGGLRLGREGRAGRRSSPSCCRRASPRSPGSSSPGRLASGSPTLAAELLLPSIAAVVVGGTAITGGVGSIWRTLVGALIISVVRIGMTFLGVNIFAQNIVFGAVLIGAVAITIDRSKIPIVK